MDEAAKEKVCGVDGGGGGGGAVGAVGAAGAAGANSDGATDEPEEAIPGEVDALDTISFEMPSNSFFLRSMYS